MLSIKDHKDLYKSINNVLRIHRLPSNVKISTITIYFVFPTLFDCMSIANYIPLNKNTIVSIKCGNPDDNNINRSLFATKKKKINTTNNKKHKMFYNQVSLGINISKMTNTDDTNIKDAKIASAKIFTRNTIHLTGCNSIESIIYTIQMLLDILKQPFYVVDFAAKKIIEKKYATQCDALSISNIKYFKIAMINSDLKMPFCIDRMKLYKLLLKYNLDICNCSFEPIKHAGVNIKYKYFNKKITILVFEKGSIIITGANNCSQIEAANNFIGIFILMNLKNIIKYIAN